MRISEVRRPSAFDLGYPFERILVPLDGSAAAEKAFSLLRSLVPKHAMRVVLAHVVEPQPTEAAAQYLRQAAAALGSQGIDARSVVRVGPVSRQLLDAASEEGASLIALSTHGGQTAEARPLGTVAQELFASTVVPVLAIPAHAGAENLRRFRTMLLPVDPRDSMEPAARMAAEFAVTFGIDLVVLLALVPRERTGRGEAEEQVGAEEHFAQLAKVFERKGIVTVQRVQAGDSVSEILRISREQKADLIAMGYRRRTSDESGRRLAGLLKESDFPVLAVPIGKPVEA